jgi:hypothetical protein
VKRLLDDDGLRRENALIEKIAGFSPLSGGLGFRPAFFDVATHAIHLSRFADGTLAPLHLIEGLPEEAIAIRSDRGHPVAAKPTLIAGFERNGFFYTRTHAARAAREWG